MRPKRANGDAKKKEKKDKIFQCELCEVTFKIVKELDAHLISEHGTNRFQCHLCTKSFNRGTTLRKHMRGVHDGNKVKIPCPQCGKLLPESTMPQHMKDVHVDKEEKQFKCDQCLFATHAARLLKAHQLKRHDKGSWKLECERCQKKFRYPFDLKRHNCVPLPAGATLETEQRGSKQPIVCVECGIEAQGREGLLNHYRVSHKKLPPGYENHEQFICEQCSDLFITEESLRKHIAKKHTNPTERQCPKCGQEFSGRLYLSQHYKLVHGAVLPSMEDCEKFLCDECPSVFFAKESLASHKRQHHMSLSDPKRTPKKRKQCPHCPKTFAAHQSWLEHIKSKHEMNTPYKCDECTRSYGTKCRLLVHKTSMHKRIKCDICGQEICNSFMLRKHKASVHGVIPKNVFHCEHCPLFFYKVLSKESHVRTHHPDTLVA